MSDGNTILQKMLDRLLAALVNGPGMNCRPYASRQRLDLAQLSRLQDIAPEEVLRKILGPERGSTIKAKVAAPKGEAAGRRSKRASSPPAIQETQTVIEAPAASGNGDPSRHAAPGNGDATASAAKPQKPIDRAYSEQQAVLNKLRTIAEDARTYEQDTGVSVLNLGFPLLSLPPGSFGAGSTRRVLAPVAFIPMSLTLKRSATPSAELECRGEGIDRVTPNTALLAWIEQQTGKSPQELDGDEEGKDPWREICNIVAFVCNAMDVAIPELFSGTGAPHVSALEANSIDSSSAQILSPIEAMPGESASMQSAPHDPLANLRLVPAPKADESPDAPTILCSAVLGLFPMTNQGLLRDTQAMLAGEGRGGPVESFLQLGVSLEAPPMENPANALAVPTQPVTPKNFEEERLITTADPCQARAVRLARQSNGLVIHGPPGTGKSQTITNIIGDHLARGQRVLLVCDKRTALDVVANRLEHMGLGRLCAQVYDPRRDQRELYKTLRDQLDELPEVATDAQAAKKLKKADGELQNIHEELTQYRESLTHRKDDHGLNFHDMVGQWLSLTEAGAIATGEPPEKRRANGGRENLDEFRKVPLQVLDERAREVEDLLQRALEVIYGNNPWVAAAGIPLTELLATPLNRVRELGGACAEAARGADATLDPAVPPFAADIPLDQQAASRTKLADSLTELLGKAAPAIVSRWAEASPQEVQQALQKIAGARMFIETFRAGAPDAELAVAPPASALSIATIGQQLSTLAAYLQIASKWYAFLPLKAKSQAATVLIPFGLTASAPNALRVQGFLIAKRARLALRALLDELSGTTNPWTDASLEKALVDHSATLAFLTEVQGDPAIAGLVPQLRKALKQPDLSAALIEGLRKSGPRALALMKLESVTADARLFDAKWLKKITTATRGGSAALPVLQPLVERIDTLEGVLRVRNGIATLEETLRRAVDKLVKQSTPTDAGMTLLRRESLAGEISRRLTADPQLQQIDAPRLVAAFDRYAELSTQKHELVRQTLQHHWVSRQKERLLATTGSRLNSLGADLRRRLTIRGERAMRLRQVVAVGTKIEGGDPLFDLCPIWLCSPETVAQVFPRAAVFDAVVFDEASQCRLEEAVPVIVRGKRLVIAGDPRQLPPTRFFESAVAISDDEEPENDQQLFEQQQGEVEDLLAASLGLDIQQSYLDVHYRSKNADLIAFSNEQFYASRLQPIPGRMAAKETPVRLEQVNGIYDKRRNEIEADRVCQLVRELLKAQEPPSIGIACFNLPQRDLIVEKLDELAGEDAGFARELDKARTRQGAGSFEGLFVKNLENVQGDERDHIIISTTYGPDTRGKFYRRFGPLGMAGGGRRLNVLVTRARQKVHVLTSIPRESYRTLPELPPGQAPGGGWLLFAYMQYAEKLTQLYAAAEDGDKSADVQTVPAPTEVKVLPTRVPSSFAEGLAHHLLESHNLGSEVYWGNDGFCVDLAPKQTPADQESSVGIICDGARFTPGDDPIDWDVFRTGILESQGWKLHRIWTPHFFRDPAGALSRIAGNGEVVGKN